MKRNYKIELYRCLCMLGVVCIHAFSWAGECSRHCWALSSPFLIGFVMISGWFGIHFKPTKIARLMGVVVTCSIIGTLLAGEGLSLQPCYGKGYWYVWAYIFVMMLSQIVDNFVEQCADRRMLMRIFVSCGVMLWAWSFLAQNAPKYIPTVAGFGDSSGVVLLLVYILVRLIRKLEWDQWLEGREFLLVGTLVVSAVLVAFGFRHNNSIFTFAYAFCILLLINKMPIPETIGRFFVFLAPSMFSVYLLHMPLAKYFLTWEHAIESATHFNHSLSQFILAILVFCGCILLDMPRRLAVSMIVRWHSGDNPGNLNVTNNRRLNEKD